MQLASFQKTVKKILIIIVPLIILAGAILMGRRVSTYFAKASTCPVKKDTVRALQVAANNAVISWETEGATVGQVVYGTGSNSFTFSTTGEAKETTTHNQSLTLLTPNTVYYYVVTTGSDKCDSTGQYCTDNCIPWSFTTTSVSAATPATASEAAIPSPTAAAVNPTSASTSLPTSAGLPPSITSSKTASASPTSTLSTFCQLVEKNIGASSADTVKWSTVKQYDIDGNGRINGVDVIKCKASGK